MSKVKIVEYIGEVMREVHFDSFEDFMEYEGVNNSRGEDKNSTHGAVLVEDGWVSWYGNTTAPVPYDVDVEVKLRNGETMVERSEWLDWSWGRTVEEHDVEQDEETCDEDIIAYRIIK